MSHLDATAVLVVLVTVGLPIAMVVALALARMRAQERQVRMIMEERRSLIEKGVTELPPPQLPALPEGRWRRRNPLRHLVLGILALAVAAGLEGGNLVKPPTRPYVLDPQWVLLIAAVGVALVIIHFVVRAYEPRAPEDPQQPGHGQAGQEPPYRP